jgi:hypothetical protein
MLVAMTNCCKRVNKPLDGTVSPAVRLRCSNQIVATLRLKRNLLIPRALILDSKVWRGSPSFRPAPFGPPILPEDSDNALSINSRSLVSMAVLKGIGWAVRERVSCEKPRFVHAEDRRFTKNYCSLDHVLQFSNVARPIIVLQHGKRRLVNRGYLLAGFLRIALQ